MSVQNEISNAIKNRQRVEILYKKAGEEPKQRYFDPWICGEALLADGKKPMVGGYFVGEHVARIPLDRIVEVKALLTEAIAPVGSTTGNDNRSWQWETIYAEWA